MESSLFYEGMSKIYDLLDVIYFKNNDANPRKALYDYILDSTCKESQESFKQAFIMFKPNQSFTQWVKEINSRNTLFICFLPCSLGKNIVIETL